MERGRLFIYLVGDLQAQTSDIGHPRKRQIGTTGIYGEAPFTSS